MCCEQREYQGEPWQATTAARPSYNCCTTDEQQAACTNAARPAIVMRSIREPRRDVTQISIPSRVTVLGAIHRAHWDGQPAWQPAAVRLAPVVRLAAALLFLSGGRAARDTEASGGARHAPSSPLVTSARHGEKTQRHIDVQHKVRARAPASQCESRSYLFYSSAQDTLVTTVCYYLYDSINGCVSMGTHARHGRQLLHTQVYQSRGPSMHAPISHRQHPTPFSAISRYACCAYT